MLRSSNQSGMAGQVAKTQRGERSTQFFISYTSTDRAWAEWIAWQLEDDGYQVLIQAWDFLPGRDWVHQMQQALSTAARVVPVLSPAYLGSMHGEAEWRVYYAKDPSGERDLLLPVRVAEVKPPGLLRTRTYVDLVGLDEGSAQAALLAAARGMRMKPATPPRFPGGGGISPATGLRQAPRFPGEPPRAGRAEHQANGRGSSAGGLAPNQRGEPNARSRSPSSEHESADQRLNLAQTRRLRDLLLKCPVVGEAESRRQTLVPQLEDEFGGPLGLVHNARNDLEVVNLLKACLRYGFDPGLNTLVTVIEHLDNNIEAVKDLRADVDEVRRASGGSR